MTLISGNIGASLIGSVSLVLSLKVLGAEVFGIFTLIQTYVRIFDGLLNFQSWDAIIKLGSEAKANNDDELLKSYIKQGFLLDIISAIIGTVVSFLLVGFIGSKLNWDHNMIFLTRIFSIVILFNIAGTPIGILRLYRKFKIFSFQKIISAVIKFIGVLIAFIIKADLFFFVIVAIITQISGYIILIYMGFSTLNANSLVGWFRVKLHKSKEFLKFALWSNINSTLSLPKKEFDKVIVSFISFEAVGVYKLFKQIVNIIGKIVTPIYQAIFPELAKLISEGNYKKAVSVSKRIGFIMLAVSSPFLIILAPTSSIWLKWIIETSSNYSVVLALFLFLQVFTNVFICVNPLFISAGYIKYNFFIGISSSLIYVSSALFLTGNFDLLGIVFASFIETVWTYVIKIYILKKKSNTLIKTNISI